MTATVTHKPKLNRYVVVGDAEAGYLSYIPFSGAVHFEHTETREELSGRGLASMAECPVVKGYLGRHKDWNDLVAGA